MKTITTAGNTALQRLDELRSGWRPGGEYPFIIGIDEELQQLRDMIEPPTDGGNAILQAAFDFDVEAWLKAKGPKATKSWPKQAIPPQTTIALLYDTLSGQIKPEIHIGLLEVNRPEEIFAKLGYGGWNDCPESHVHVALHQYWSAKYRSSLVALSNDIVECWVLAPPSTREAALKLAREQFTYCYDIVEQGVGSVSKLGSSLLEAKFWYFWWD